MLFIFQSGTEFIKLKIDRINKTVEMATSKTNYRFYPIPYSELFGTKDTSEQKETQAEYELKKNGEFETYLVKELLKKGYLIKKKDNKIINQKEYYKERNIKIESVYKGGRKFL